MFNILYLNSEPINWAILQLREEGFLDELKSKWWYDRSECEHVINNSFFIFLTNKLTKKNIYFYKIYYYIFNSNLIF
jgi:hypothetical protein